VILQCTFSAVLDPSMCRAVGPCSVSITVSIRLGHRLPGAGVGAGADVTAVGGGKWTWAWTTVRCGRRTWQWGRWRLRRCKTRFSGLLVHGGNAWRCSCPNGDTFISRACRRGYRSVSLDFQRCAFITDVVGQDCGS